MTYAVIESGGKQYRVQSGDVVALERIRAEAGETVRFDKVLLITENDKTTLGTPVIAGAAVTGEVLGQGRDKKILVFKKKRRKAYRRTRGHRQAHTRLRITGIEPGTATA